VGRSLLAACDRLRNSKPDSDAPREVIDKAWQRSVVQLDGRVDLRACTFSVLNICRPPFIGAMCLLARAGDTSIGKPICSPIRSGKRHAPVVCRTPGLPPELRLFLDSLTVELDKTYREVASTGPPAQSRRRPNNRLS